MRQQIAAANWKMNCSLQEAENLLHALSDAGVVTAANHQVIIAVPFPYLLLANSIIGKQKDYFISAQNCYQKGNGAYTGEVSAAILQSCNIPFVIIGHSERRMYFHENNQLLAEKVLIALENDIRPIFCCGETLEIREKGAQNEFVAGQIRDSLFGLSPEQFSKIIIAYEPIWAIGTGKTATAGQAQEMHAHIRQTVAAKYGDNAADELTILYGGSVKAGNAKEIFGKPDVDGGLVGGASLDAGQFVKIIQSLKN